MKLSRRDFNKATIAAGTTVLTGVRSAIAGADEILKRPIPSSGELVPIVGLGTNRYGVGDDADARAPQLTERAAAGFSVTLFYVSDAPDQRSCSHGTAHHHST